MAGAVEEREAAEQRGARAAGEHLHQRLGAAAERALGGGLLHRLRRRDALPVLGLEAAHELARARADRIAIRAQRADVDLARELADLGARHADAEVLARDAELRGPGVVEHLRPPG